VRLFTSIRVHTADLGQHADITLQDVPNAKYQLELFVGNTEDRITMKDNRTWTPVQRLYVLCFFIMYTIYNLYVCRAVPPTSEMRVEILMKRGHGPWAKKEQNSKMIDLQNLFSDLPTSRVHELKVQGQSCFPPCAVRSYLTEKCRGCSCRKARML
jgi:hypothetical protein